MESDSQVTLTAQKGLRIVFTVKDLQKVLLYFLRQKGEGAKIISKGRRFSDWTHSANEASCSRKKKRNEFVTSK